MELLPQSREALAEYTPPAIDDLESDIRKIERWAVKTVPECVAVSVTLLEDDLTFTFVDADALAGHSVGGRGAESGTVASVSSEVLDEGVWAAMAREAARAGVASSVSLPIFEDGRAVLCIDLYASTADAFDGRIEELEGALGARHGRAITNTDLRFETRVSAESAPQILRRQHAMDVAMGVIAAREGVSTEQARVLLDSAAEMAGVEPTQAALVVHALHRLRT